MHNLPVHWSEGLFLRPHHFQAADRFWTELSNTCEQWDHQYNYGVRRLELSDEAIANYQLQLNVCHARMRDGTLISIDPGRQLDRVDLKEAFAKETVVRVFLAVPKLKLGSANVGSASDAGKPRYVETVQALQDESLGGNDQEMRLRSLNVRLLLSTQDMAGYEVLPIAQIQRAGEREAVPLVDANYFPPMLACDAWPPLGRDIVRAIYDLIGKKIEVLSRAGDQPQHHAGLPGAGRSGPAADAFAVEHRLQHAGSDGLCAGRASADGLHRVVPDRGPVVDFRGRTPCIEVPPYDHDDLARIFRWVKERIELLLGSIRDYEYEQRFFVGEGKGMRVTLEAKWFNAEWQWFVGVARGTLSEKECLGLLSPGRSIGNWAAPGRSMPCSSTGRKGCT